MRCTATGRVWVGAAMNLESIRNRIWFGLRLGKHDERAMQDEWNAHGESEFEYEVLEALDEDVSAFAVKDLLTAKKAEWATRLGAGRGLRGF